MLEKKSVFGIRAALWAEKLGRCLEYYWSCKNTLGKLAVAVSTRRHLIRVLNERSVTDGGHLCPLWLVILKSVWHSIGDVLWLQCSWPWAVVSYTFLYSRIKLDRNTENIELKYWTEILPAQVFNSCNIQGNGQAFRLIRLFWWQKTDLIFPAFFLRFLNFAVQFCFRRTFSFQEKPFASSLTVAWFLWPITNSCCATFLFLPHFDVICDLLLNRRTATWNLFVK